MVKISALDEMRLGDMFGKEDEDIILCYPEKEANLWSLPKQFGRPQKKIRALNSIPDGEQTVKKKFLIV